MNDKILLQKISPYNANKNLIVSNQTTGDIITGIIEMQQKYCNDYKKLLPYFEADNLEDTANNVFEYLKNNFKYVIESENLQSLRSPSAIISTGKKIGIDCKQYSLFFAGILSEYIKKYNLKNKLYFRFAGYEGKPIGHVFVYFLDDNKNEIWCDCVLNYLNDRSIEPTKYKDKIINNMALITISGVPRVEGLVPSYESIGKSQQVFGSVHKRMGDNGGGSDGGGSDGGGSEADMWIELGKFIVNLFGKKSNPNDWQGWDSLDNKDGNPLGTQAAHWSLSNGDDPQNEASNILSYMAANPNNITKMINAAIQRLGQTKENFLKALKFKLDNYSNASAEIKNMTLNQFINKFLNVNTGGGGNGGGGGNLPTTKAGFNPLLLIGLIAAGAFLFLKPKI